MVCSVCKNDLPEDSFNKYGRPYRTRIIQYFCRECQRESKWKYRYGLKWGDYLRMLHEQNNKCKICEITLDDYRIKYPKKKWFCVDHNHKTGAVRSLLCNNCNVFIAHAQESKEILLAGIRYLEG